MSYSIPRAACFTARRVPFLSNRGRPIRVYSQVKSPMDKPGGKVTKKEELLEAKKKLEEIIKSSKCNPILVRLAWHDSGTYVSRQRLHRASACFAKAGTASERKLIIASFFLTRISMLEVKKAFSKGVADVAYQCLCILLSISIIHARQGKRKCMHFVIDAPDAIVSLRCPRPAPHLHVQSPWKSCPFAVLWTKDSKVFLRHSGQGQE